MQAVYQNAKKSGSKVQKIQNLGKYAIGPIYFIFYQNEILPPSTVSLLNTAKTSISGDRRAPLHDPYHKMGKDVVELCDKVDHI